ncbi:MAG: Hsp20/alpha crystallin family protein [Candidatus Atribacteria bacterium]|nr:Hsp20/alpha crystallin family protein [Candidatus Atribacteria bacterium]
MKTMDSWWDDFDLMQKEMRRFMEHVSGKKPHLLGLSERSWKPFCDVFETEHQLIVVVELAGIFPDEVDITVQSRKLILQGERREITSLPKIDYHQMEINFGPFSREIELPIEVESHSVRAKYHSGFLIIECQKKETLNERRVPLA